MVYSDFAHTWPGTFHVNDTLRFIYIRYSKLHEDMAEKGTYKFK